MHETVTIMRRELKSYFYSPIAYVFGLLFLVIACYIGTIPVREASQATMHPFFGFLPAVFLVFLPALSMRLWAEERKSGTLELLLTFPVTIPQLISGKFLASMAYLAVLLLLTVGLPITLAAHGELDWLPVGARYLATLLMAAAYVSLGMFWSSITRDQIIAFLLATTSLLALYFMPRLSPYLTGVLPDWLGGDLIVLFLFGLSPSYYFESIARGVVDLGDLLYYLCFCVFFLHANALVLQAKRIKG
jgi:ABC-2 type transport system permease protein